ncbi:MAG: hypothetical protein ABL994_01245 [Verrucomicrobiales bacterium]
MGHSKKLGYFYGGLSREPGMETRSRGQPPPQSDRQLADSPRWRRKKGAGVEIVGWIDVPNLFPGEKIAVKVTKVEALSIPPKVSPAVSLTASAVQG